MKKMLILLVMLSASATICAMQKSGEQAAKEVAEKNIQQLVEQSGENKELLRANLLNRIKQLGDEFLRDFNKLPIEETYVFAFKFNKKYAQKIGFLNLTQLEKIVEFVHF